MMAGRDGAFGILIGAAVGTLFLVPACSPPQDNGEGVPLGFRIAGGQGYASAQYNLGVAYADGIGVQEDDAEAVRFFRLPAEQGHARAQSNLGLKYSLGDGIPEDQVYAYMWLDLAATQGNERARGGRDLVVQQMTREQIAEAQKLSREWIETHPQDGGN